MMPILKPLTTLLSKTVIHSSSRQLKFTNHLKSGVFLTRRKSSSESSVPKTQDEVSVTFLRPDGTKTSVKTSQDKTLYDAVIDNNVDIDGFGACEGTLCCTTCHLIFKQSDYEKVGPPSDEELDMLDLAYGLTDTSRLGCQVLLRKDLDPLEVQVPASINDVREG